jgi:hypothetical protein
VVVFTHPNAQLDVAEAPDEAAEVPVLTGAALKKYIRSQPKGQALSMDLRRRVITFLKGEEEAAEEDVDAE